MAKVRITTLTDGMVLSSDALDRTGKLVLPAGSVIDTASRNKLLMARVRKVSIRSFAAAGDNDDAEAADDDTATRPRTDTTVMQNRLLRLAHMFEPFKDDELMRNMCRLAIKCAQERLIRG